MSKMIETFKKFKEIHNDKLILFRVGDFYEAYCEDAQKASSVLGITLTENKRENIVTTGFPHSALDTYLPKLIRAGLRIAICDDISETAKTEPDVEDADAEEIKTEEPQQEESNGEDVRHATLYTPKGNIIDVVPKNGKILSLREMQLLVGGYIEIIRLNDGRLIIVNEEGLLHGLLVNIEATNILRRDHSTTQYIVGNAIVCDADIVE